MRWIRLVPIVLLVAVLPVQAQQPDGHAVLMPDTLKWVEPAVLPGARLAVLQGDPAKERPVGVGPTDITFVNPADDPRKK